ncbi:uncharacterized protein P884DRAFT_194745 [Thermothelomyces heterothallicus CBS 202.75]|uniref:uncharacterized protein n=1 Tax=Thermothelomyces heterothallicus CBS 202.75 TaxID=1149848 RepID=UPI0037434E86
MHRPRILGRTIKLIAPLALLAVAGLPPAQANKNRKDLCGVSMHTSDLGPEVGNFSVIDAAWGVPEVIAEVEDEDGSGGRAPYVSQGVALCCGDDCSTRLAAGAWASPREPGRSSSASAMFQLSPVFTPVLIPAVHQFELNSSDVLWTRVEIRGPSDAQITFSKFESAISNTTISVDLRVAVEDGGTVLRIATRGNGAELEFDYAARYRDAERPALCGDSAWWFVSDSFDPGQDTDRPLPLARFSPVLVAGHGLRASTSATSEEGDRHDRSFPADLPLSGLARFWDMVRAGPEGQTEVLCNTRGFVDTGMTLLQSPHPWGV